MRRLILAAVVLAMPAVASAQAIPVPANPVLFCGTQATPNADSYTLVFDGGTATALVMDATLDAQCPAGSTHSFKLPAAQFTVGTHTLVVKATNVFGTTDGPVYTVTVGIAPGQFTITAVKQG